MALGKTPIRAILDLQAKLLHHFEKWLITSKSQNQSF